MHGTETGKTKKRRWACRAVLILVSLAVVLVFLGRAYYRYKFPYGNTHACSKQLGLALRIYAGDHDGWLPHGESTPGASVGLLASEGRDNLRLILGGKTIPADVVLAGLTNNGGFGPETCGWHYVEGLCEDDGPSIAVLWDKVVGLGHHGQPQPDSMHEVVLLDGSTHFISKVRWPQFVAEQKESLAKVIASRGSNSPPIRWSGEETLGPNRFTPPAHP